MTATVSFPAEPCLLQPNRVRRRHRSITATLFSGQTNPPSQILTDPADTGAERAVGGAAFAEDATAVVDRHRSNTATVSSPAEPCPPSSHIHRRQGRREQWEMQPLRRTRQPSQFIFRRNTEKREATELYSNAQDGYESTPLYTMPMSEVAAVTSKMPGCHQGGFALYQLMVEAAVDNN